MNSLTGRHFLEQRHGVAELRIEVQPEEWHRARYLTEGSRGAVKDRSGEGFPVVKVNTTIQMIN